MNDKKFHLIYYKNLIDSVLIRFFNEYNDQFSKSDENYILANNLTITKLEKIFKEYLKDEIKKYIQPFDILNIKYYFIIGACLPKNNILLNFKSDKYFPKKLDKIINANFPVKYYLKEKDIKLDLVKFNKIFIDIFNNFFESKKKLLNFLGKDYKNVFFIQHKNLDCYSMFKIIKFLFGRNNCNNLYKEYFINKPNILIAVNEKIDEYIHNKSGLNTLPDFKLIIEDIKTYISNCLNSIQ